MSDLQQYPVKFKYELDTQVYNCPEAQIWLVPLKIVFNFSRLKPVLNWSRFLVDLWRGLNSLNSGTGAGKQSIYYQNWTLINLENDVVLHIID